MTPPLHPLLLLSLPLLVAACHEKPAEEAPFAARSGNLLGAWQLEHQEGTNFTR